MKAQKSRKVAEKQESTENQGKAGVSKSRLKQERQESKERVT